MLVITVSINGKNTEASRVVYKRRQPVKFDSFFAIFRRLLSLFREARYVEEMMYVRSHNLFAKLWLLKN